MIGEQMFDREFFVPAVFKNRASGAEHQSREFIERIESGIERAGCFRTRLRHRPRSEQDRRLPGRRDLKRNFSTWTNASCRLVSEPRQQILRAVAQSNVVRDGYGAFLIEPHRAE